MARTQIESTQYHAEKIRESSVRTATLAQMDAKLLSFNTMILDEINSAENDPGNLAPAEYITELWQIQKDNAKTRLTIKEARRQEQARRTDHRHAWVDEHNRIMRKKGNLNR